MHILHDTYTKRGSISIHPSLQDDTKGLFFWACFGHDGTTLSYGYAPTYQYALTNANIALIRAS